MTILIGRDSFLGFTEVTQTTELAGTGPAEFIFVDSFSFKRTRTEEIIPEIIGQRAMRRRVLGDITCNGSFVKSVDVNNGCALYRHLLSGTLTSASIGAGSFTHTFSEGDDMETNERLQFMAGPGGVSATSRNFIGGIVESYSLSIAPGAVPKETWGLQFEDHGAVLNTAPTIALTYVDPINYNQCLVYLGVSITAVSQVATRDITLNISNNPEMNREIGTATIRQFTFGQKNVTGNFNIVFENATMYNNFINNTSLAMRIDLTSADATSGTSHAIKFSLPQIHFNGATPDVSLGQIIQPVEFTALYSSNASYQIKIEVINSQTTVPR